MEIRSVQRITDFVSLNFNYCNNSNNMDPEMQRGQERSKTTISEKKKVGFVLKSSILVLEFLFSGKGLGLLY